MHVSPGLGTTFVPFRFFARPEATELVLRVSQRALNGNTRIPTFVVVLTSVLKEVDKAI